MYTAFLNSLIHKHRASLIVTLVNHSKYVYRNPNSRLHFIKQYATFMHMFAVQNKYDLELDIISHGQIVLIIPVPLLQRIQMLLEIQLFEICKGKYPIS